MSIILVDMDGVLADWGGGWNLALDRYGSAADGIPRHRDQRTFDLHHERTPDELHIITEVMNTMDYAALAPIRGARTALRNMVRAGHTVRVVTTPWPTNPTCASDKIAWMVQWFGPEWARRVFLASDKTYVRGDFLIDDKPVVTGDLPPYWEHIIFTQPYNVDQPQRRINAWNEWEAVIHG